MSNKELVLSSFRKDCPDFNKVLEKLFDGNDDALFGYVLALSKVNGSKARDLLIYPVIAAYERISELEQTLSTYDTALKSEGKVPGQLEFEFMKEDA